MTAAESTPAELARIVAEYRRREASLPPTWDALSEPATLFIYQQRSRALLAALARHDVLPLHDKKILDIGCGSGQSLIDFESWGAQRDNLAGIELIEDSANLARVRLCTRRRAADIRTGNAAELPWPDGMFDVVSQSTVFTSILDESLRAAIAAEMMRVTRPGGVIIWYDFRVNNPANRHVRRVGARELRSLFAGCRVDLRAATLAPPVARRLVPVSWIASLLIEKLAVLNTHYVGVIRLPAMRNR